MSEKVKLTLATNKSMVESMRTVEFEDVVEMVRLCCLSAAVKLPEDVELALQKAFETETRPLAKELISQCLENAKIALFIEEFTFLDGLGRDFLP